MASSSSSSSSAPWCVGSVFPATNLLTGPAASPLGPFFFDPCDTPQCVLNTGCAFSFASHQQANPQHQVEDFLGGYKEAFFPQEPLIENLQEDASLNSTIAQSCSYSVGNRLEGIQNREGRLQLFFPVGANIDRVGSCIYFPKSNGSVWSKEKPSADNGEEYSSSSSVCQPILQIAANKNEAFCSSELTNVPLAVRTLYQIHWLTSEMEKDCISFGSEGLENFQHCTSHVAWNPHLLGEAAVILENGDVNFFDLRSQKYCGATSILRMEDYIGKEVSSHFDQTLYPKDKRRKKRGQRPGSVDAEYPLFAKKWWSCEYAWHPKNLVVAGHTEIRLIDLRQKLGSICVSSIRCATGFSSYCNQMQRTERFTALTRANYDGMFQFAVASTNHLMLYDIRQPNTPLLQWEHRMKHEPPGLLQMYCISDLCSSTLDTLNTPLVAGRVILACAYRSGEIHAFCYGPHPQAYPTNLGGHRDDVGLNDMLFSWELPIKLTNEKAHCYEKIERAFEVHDTHLEIFLPRYQKPEHVSGLFNFSPNSGAPNFTMLQLTGTGFIISQNFKVSENLESRKHQQLHAVSQHLAFLKTTAVDSCRSGLSGKSRNKQYRMENLPDFLNYIQYGSVLPTYIQSGDSSANGYHDATVTDYEHHKDTADKLNEARLNQ